MSLQTPAQEIKAEAATLSAGSPTGDHSISTNTEEAHSQPTPPILTSQNTDVTDGADDNASIIPLWKEQAEGTPNPNTSANASVTEPSAFATTTTSMEPGSDGVFSVEAIMAAEKIALVSRVTQCEEGRDGIDFAETDNGSPDGAVEVRTAIGGYPDVQSLTGSMRPISLGRALSSRGNFTPSVSQASHLDGAHGVSVHEPQETSTGIAEPIATEPNLIVENPSSANSVGMPNDGETITEKEALAIEAASSSEVTQNDVSASQYGSSSISEPSAAATTTETGLGNGSTTHAPAFNRLDPIQREELDMIPEAGTTQENAEIIPEEAIKTQQSGNINETNTASTPREVLETSPEAGTTQENAEITPEEPMEENAEVLPEEPVATQQSGTVYGTNTNDDTANGSGASPTGNEVLATSSLEPGSSASEIAEKQVEPASPQKASGGELAARLRREVEERLRATREGTPDTGSGSEKKTEAGSESGTAGQIQTQTQPKETTSTVDTTLANNSSSKPSAFKEEFGSDGTQSGSVPSSPVARQRTTSNASANRVSYVDKSPRQKMSRSSSNSGGLFGLFRRRSKRVSVSEVSAENEQSAARDEDTGSNAVLSESGSAEPALTNGIYSGGATAVGTGSDYPLEKSAITSAEAKAVAIIEANAIQAETAGTFTEQEPVSENIPIAEKDLPAFEPIYEGDVIEPTGDDVIEPNEGDIAEPQGGETQYEPQHAHELTNGHHEVNQSVDDHLVQSLPTPGRSGPLMSIIRLLVVWASLKKWQALKSGNRLSRTSAPSVLPSLLPRALPQFRRKRIPQLQRKLGQSR